MREERRLRVFGKRVLRRKLGPKTDEVTGEWRKLHNERFILPVMTSVYISVLF